MEYDKPHLTLPEQPDKLQRRGLEIADRDHALRLLETVGYYRLSAYAYPFRELVPVGQPRETSVQFRRSGFLPGTKFSWIEDLWAFDRALRLLVLDAIETVEIAVRSKIGYHLGARDKFAYLSIEHLDSDSCLQPDADEPERSLYEIWGDRYLHHQNKATAEDFIKHYVEKYDAKLPIWVATEIMEFGQLVRLFGFMRSDDQSRVSGEVAGVSGSVFYRWLKVANYVRNVSAHHARLWNRTLTYKLGRIPDNAPRLLHLNGDTSYRARVYGFCSVLAHMADHIRPEARWPGRFLDLMTTFPETSIDVEYTMGMPKGWESLPLWLSESGR